MPKTAAAKKDPAREPILKTRPIQKTSISDEIVRQVMTEISSGRLRPGQRLPSERDLCKQFQTGRSSLREALRCLSIMGVLTARVGEGTSVATDGSKFLGTITEWRVITERYDVRNLMEVRLGLETVAAASTAERATPTELAAIALLVEKMHDALGSTKRFGALDLEFHLAISRASQNLALGDLLMMIRSQLDHAVSTVLKLPNALPLSLKEHEAILHALLRHDTEEARRAMHTHLAAALRRFDAT